MTIQPSSGHKSDSGSHIGRYEPQPPIHVKQTFGRFLDKSLVRIPHTQIILRFVPTRLRFLILIIPGIWGLVTPLIYWLGLAIPACPKTTKTKAMSK